MNIMTKRGSEDNVVTYEHYCDTKADLANIPQDQISLGSVAIVLKDEDDSMGIYLANSNKEWISFSTGGSGGGSEMSDISLANLVDVSLANPNDGDTLVYDATSEKWVAQAGDSGGGGSTTLAGLTDVDLSNPTDGQTLVYNATAGKWENGDSGGVMYVHATVNVSQNGEYVVSVEEQIEDILAAIRAGKLLVADVNEGDGVIITSNRYYYLKTANISTEYDEYISFKDIVVASTGESPNSGGEIYMASINYEGSGEEGVDGYWYFDAFSVIIPVNN